MCGVGCVGSGTCWCDGLVGFVGDTVVDIVVDVSSMDPKSAIHFDLMILIYYLSLVFFLEV